MITGGTLRTVGYSDSTGDLFQWWDEVSYFGFDGLGENLTISPYPGPKIRPLILTNFNFIFKTVDYLVITFPNCKFYTSCRPVLKAMFSRSGYLPWRIREKVKC